MKYIKQLDTLRAVAVLFVIVGHWLKPINGFSRIAYLAAAGVNIFFVLSGFLITWILLVNREQAIENHNGFGTVLKNFYIRRTLRIFPIYYLSILFFFFFPSGAVENVHGIFPWLFTYTSNIYFFVYNTWDGHVSHLWSLAAEEQFYLIWPSFMLFISRKYLVHTILVFLLMGVIVEFFFRGVPFMTYLTVTCFSSFGMGGLLAWVIVYKPEFLTKGRKLLGIPAFISFAILIWATIKMKWDVVPLQRTFHSIIALYVIAYIIDATRKGQLKMKWFWDNKALIFIGKISYGLYLFHGFLPEMVSQYMIKWFNFNPESYFSFSAYFILKVLVVVLFSWISWMLIEKPILSLKRFFEYNSKANKSNSAAA